MRKTTLPTLLVANPSMRRRRRLRNRKLIVALFVGAVCFLFVTGLLLYSVATSGNGSSDAGRVKPVVEETDPPAEVRSEYPTIHTEEAHPVDPRFAPAEVTDEHRVRTLDEINQHLFFRVRHVASGMWLGYDAAVSDTPNRLTLLIQRRRQNDAFAVQGALGMYLAVNRDDSVVMDRSTARSQEMWNLKVAPSSGTFYLAALKTGKLVRGKDCHSKPNERDGQLYATSGQTCALVADVVPENVHESDAISEAAPARWEIFVEPDPNCYVSHETVADLRQDAVARNGEFSEERAAVMKEIMRRCHGEPTGEDADEEKKGTTFKASTGGSGLRGAMTVPLFGSPKPLTELKPLDASNKYDAFIIARRTIANWACISGFLPLILADDSGNKALVEELNRVNAAHETASFTPIRLSPSFELHKRFSQPTYRGLFLRAFEEFPEAMVVMYANSDILFTSTAMETIRAVAASFEVMRRSQPRLTGWFAVGQRTNVDVDPHWSIGAVPGEDEGAMRAEEEEQRNWESHMETTLKKKGKIFQTLAEDYFIVSRGMFDWNNEIPDFVVGGTAFDNWITTKAVKKSREGTALVVDVTQTLTAIHQNHATNIKASHQHPKSQYNNRLAASRGGWSLGHTSDCPHLTVRGGDGSILVIPKRQLLVK